MSVNNTMKLLIVASSFPPDTGGIQSLMYNFAESSDHDVSVLTLGKPEGWKEFDEEQDFDITRLKDDRLSVFRLLYYVYRRSCSFDGIYFGSWRNSLTGLLSPLPYAIHVHGRELLNPVTGVETGLKRTLRVVSLRNADLIVSNSKFTKELASVRSKNKTSISVVHPGAEDMSGGDGNKIRQKLGISEDKFVLLTVSRLDPRKGHDLVLKAIRNIEDIEYVIVGSGQEENNLKELINDLELEDEVHMEGYVDEKNLSDYYDLCDAFIMPSKSIESTGNVEGFGIVFIEANSAGRPVIGSSTGGINSAVNEEETGLLCSPTVERVKSKIRCLKSDGKLRERMGREGEKWAEKHSWKVISEEMDEEIREYLS